MTNKDIKLMGRIGGHIDKIYALFNQLSEETKNIPAADDPDANVSWIWPLDTFESNLRAATPKKTIEEIHADISKHITKKMESLTSIKTVV